MIFQLGIHTGNADMQDGYALSEAIEKVAELVKHDHTSGTVRDVNGNNVGEWSVLYTAE